MGTGQYDGLGAYCGLSTASEVFLIVTTKIKCTIKALENALL